MTGCYTTSQEFRKEYVLQETNNFDLKTHFKSVSYFLRFLIHFETEIKCRLEESYQNLETPFGICPLNRASHLAEFELFVNEIGL